MKKNKHELVTWIYGWLNFYGVKLNSLNNEDDINLKNFDKTLKQYYKKEIEYFKDLRQIVEEYFGGKED